MATQHVPPPNPRDLLPPVLAVLATASATKEPPVALYPLCSPILVQRLHFLSGDNWISQLNGDKDKDAASRLPAAINNIHLEPHPVSGEIELEDPVRVLYRRSDPETLHARFVLADLKLVVQYLWTTGGENGDAWKLAGLRSIQDENDGTEWYTTVEEANEKGFRWIAQPISTTAGLPTPPNGAVQPEPAQQEEEDEDDGSYWAAYDKTPGGTPGRTPMPRRSPAPFTTAAVGAGAAGQSERDYFARYADEVQPALDPYDPDEDVHGQGPGPSVDRPPAYDTTDVPPNDTSPHVHNALHTPEEPSLTSTANGSPKTAELSHPRPTSPSSTGSVARLEREAAQSSQAEVAIKQHISHEIKSLHRLARSAGIGLEEFRELVNSNLAVLSMLADDD